MGRHLSCPQVQGSGALGGDNSDSPDASSLDSNSPDAAINSAGVAKTPKTHRSTTDATKTNAAENHAPETEAAEVIKTVEVPVDPEDSSVGAYTPDYEVIPPRRRRAIVQCCWEDLGVRLPREF